jgi:hypothetical protein
MRNRIEAKPKLRLKSLYIVSGTAVLATIVIVIVLALGGFSSKQSNADQRFPTTESASERWVVETVSLNEDLEGIDVEINANASAYLNLKLFNKERELLMKKSIKLNEGLNSEGFQELSFLTKGKYLVVVSGEDKTVEKWVTKD